MDPNANLLEQLDKAYRIAYGDPEKDWSTETAEELADLVLALNNWITTGGFLPTSWRKD